MSTFTPQPPPPVSGWSPELPPTGPQLAARREAAGVSRLTIARMLGVTPSYVGQLERGALVVPETLARIANALDLIERNVRTPVKSRALTERQQGVLNQIAGYIRDHGGQSPSMREVGEMMGTRSTGHVDYLLQALVAHGCITMTSYQARSIRLTGKGLDAPTCPTCGQAIGTTCPPPAAVMPPVEWEQD